MRQHWFDVGAALAVVLGGYLIVAVLSPLSLVLWMNLLALFLHQFEEYRYPGYFPGMLNQVMFASQQSDRYPLNANTALIVNVFGGWLTYFLAAVLGEQGIWLGIATMLISVGNFVAHIFVFNLRGKSLYNPGMMTAAILFLPVAVYFFFLLFRSNLGTMLDWTLGIGLGILLNYVGILKTIDWLKDERTSYVFPKRFLPPALR